jgi:hypothetical protein
MIICLEGSLFVPALGHIPAAMRNMLRTRNDLV